MADAKLRHAIAFEAARLMYDRVESEYFTAKLKAAKRLCRGLVGIDAERGLISARADRVSNRIAYHVALGGGAPMDAETQVALAGHTVVFLDVGISDASKRIGFDQSRPLLSVNPRASWTRLMNERRPTYTRLATHVVDTATRTPEDIAAEIVALLGGAR